MEMAEWLTVKPAAGTYKRIKEELADAALNTVCAEAHCPNITECWSSGTATFMVLGSLCTRGCRFCSVPKSLHGKTIDPEEPRRLAETISRWKLRYAVITSVCRDDLQDQGAAHFAACVSEVKKLNPTTKVEVLIPDFRNESACLKSILDSGPDVVGHNIESVERLSPSVRDRRASYHQSLDVLSNAKRMGARYTKSAIMLGIGEENEEVLRSMLDLRRANVDFLAIGQYLRPSMHHLEVKEYVKPERFGALRDAGLKMGFKYIAAGPFVRSSYRAWEYFQPFRR